MILPDHIFAVIRALHAQHLTLALGDDEARRLLQQKIVETAVARFSDEGWGWKKASEGRPPSKDSIANNRLAPGHVLAWDCFNGATREPARSEAFTIDDQIFISLTGRNLTGVEAERIGLVSQVVPENELDSYVDTMAKELGGRNAVTLESAKIAAYLQKDLPFDMALQSDDLVQHRMRYYTNPLSDVEGYLQSQKGGGTVKYVKPEDRK